MEENNETTEQNPVQKNPDDILNINVGRIIVGLTEIGNLEIENFEINIGISKTISNLSLIEKAYVKSTQALMKKHIKRDDVGGLQILNGFYVFKSEKDKDEYDKLTEALNETVITEKVFKLKTTELEKIKGIKGTMMAKCHELIIYDKDVKL